MNDEKDSKPWSPTLLASVEEMASKIALEEKKEKLFEILEVLGDVEGLPSHKLNALAILLDVPTHVVTDLWYDTDEPTVKMNEFVTITSCPNARKDHYFHCDCFDGVETFTARGREFCKMGDEVWVARVIGSLVYRPIALGKIFNGSKPKDPEKLVSMGATHTPMELNSEWLGDFFEKKKAEAIASGKPVLGVFQVPKPEEKADEGAPDNSFPLFLGRVVDVDE
jgi:hypothetical protein